VDCAFVTYAQAVFKARAIQPLMQAAFHSPILPIGIEKFLGGELSGGATGD
jgi:hypothetical protein